MTAPQHIRPHHRRTLAAITLAAGLIAGSIVTGPLSTSPATAAPDTGGLALGGDNSSLLSAHTSSLAPGLDLTEFRRLQGTGWVTGQVMVADLATPTLSMDVLDSGTVSGGAPVSQQIAGKNAVAAINGDYFDMNRSGAPVGTNVSTTRGVLSAGAGSRPAFTVADGKAVVQSLTSRGSVDIGGERLPLSSINSPSIPKDTIGYFTSLWGTHPLAASLGAPGPLPAQIAMATVTDGTVVSVTADPAAIGAPAAIANGSGVLVARDGAAEKLMRLAPGDPVDVAVGTSADVDLAVSGSQRLLIDGVQTTDEQVEAARTAIGVAKDGTTVYVVTVDGRAGDARGMTIQELGRLFLDLGAYNAVNLDGGGSTTLLTRAPGTTEPVLTNRPSDGSERVVANSLAFFSSAPANTLADVQLESELSADAADAVFPGSTRTIRGTGLDANFAGVETKGTFASASSAITVAPIDGQHARITGVAAGAGAVSFSAEGKSARAEFRVLGTAQRLRASTQVVSLPESSSSKVVTLRGVDGDGFSAPLEITDVTVTSGDGVSVTPRGVNEFVIRPTVDSGSATVTFEALGHSIDVAVTVGFREEPFGDVTDPALWKHETARASGALSTSEGPNGLPALRLTHDFSSSTGTRGSYATARTPILLPGQPQALTLWVNGDGNGSWPRLEVKTGAGVVTNLDGPNVTWTGWQQVRFPVPAGTAYPLTFTKFRLMETRSGASYHGDVSFAGLTAVVAPDVAQPVRPKVFDPVIVTDGSVAVRAQQIAVLSDSQFVGRNPNSGAVEGARHSLREIVAAKPDILIINGDFVDEAAPIDFELAKRILDEEVGSAIPWVYVPGNHEVMGGKIDNFRALFGDTTTSRRVGSTQIITLNTAAGSFRASDRDQLAWLDRQLAAAAADRAVSGVLVFSHHPADDPLVSKSSQLGDRYEAAAFTKTLAEFRADSGKSIAAINAHAGVFHATSTDGVSQFISGNSGKGPAGVPSEGGFTGWTMLGINPGSGKVGKQPVTVSDRIGWMRAETKPRIDELHLTAPAVLAVGETAAVSAWFTQDGGRRVPVAWPVSSRWSGENLVVDDGTGVERSAGVLRLNPTTGQVTATGPGEGTVTVTVNGVEASAHVVVPEVSTPVDPETPVGPETPVDPETPTVPGTPANAGGPGNAPAGGPLDDSSSEDSGGILPRTGGFPVLPFALGGVLLAIGAATLMSRMRRAR